MYAIANLSTVTMGITFNILKLERCNLNLYQLNFLIEKLYSFTAPSLPISCHKIHLSIMYGPKTYFLNSLVFKL